MKPIYDHSLCARPNKGTMIAALVFTWVTESICLFPSVSSHHKILSFFSAGISFSLIYCHSGQLYMYSCCKTLKINVWRGFHSVIHGSNYWSLLINWWFLSYFIFWEIKCDGIKYSFDIYVLLFTAVNVSSYIPLYFGKTQVLHAVLYH